jgi:hypothetical protein
MKFFSKNSSSEILKQGLTYQKNRAENNAKLKDLLIQEQYHFCAYTEKYFDELDSVEVEHFDSSKKYNDDYFNYYAVLRKPNLYKKDEAYKNSKFFETLFFQNQTVLMKRIHYIKDEFVFEATDDSDQEAKDFIDFLGLNNHDLYNCRKNHIKRLAFILPNLNDSQKINYFQNHRTELSFITMIEHEFDLELSEFYS